MLPQIGDLSLLQALDLSNNQLSAAFLPSGLLLSLQELRLNDNLLTGCFPPSLSYHCSAPTVDFSNNAGLPGNGDFAAFCTTGAGDCTRDLDNDGYPFATDCNDDNASIHPNATETCNGMDDDCDGSVDEGLMTFYRDQDGDGYGNSAVTQQGVCPAPSGRQ